MIKNDFVLHPHTGKKYSVRGRFCCLSKMCVYLLKCPCGLCYVGKTTRELKTRVSEHKSSIRLHDEKSPVARHFNAAGHGVCDLRFQGIELVKPMRRGGDRGRLLLQREAYWQFLLNTESPKGLNESLSLSCFLQVYDGPRCDTAYVFCIFCIFLHLCIYFGNYLFTCHGRYLYTLW